MKRFTLTQLTGAAIRLAPLVIAAAFFGAAGKASAAQLCAGGSPIYNSSHVVVGCTFSTWGPAEQSQCNGATVFAPANSGPGTCHVCVQPAYATQVQQGNFTGLTGNFSCLNCAQPPSGITDWWTLDETNGAYGDLIGSLTGVGYGGVQSVPGEVVNAAKFNGASQYIQIPGTNTANSPLDIGPGPFLELMGSPIPASDLPLTAGSGSFSIDAWIKLDECSPSSACAADSGVRVIMEKRSFNPPSTYKGYSFYLYNQYLGLQLADNGTAPGYSNYGAPTLVVPADGNWHFVAVSIFRSQIPAALPTNPPVAGGPINMLLDAFEVQFTLDNQSPVLVSGPARFGSLANSSNANIGMDTIGAGSVFNGSIDEVEFFNGFVLNSAWQTIVNAKCSGKCRPQ
jgi:hypothetical protein